MTDENGISRRDFLKSAGFAAAATTAFVASRKGYAQDGVLTAGLIGCGGRGTGAAHQWIEGSENVKVTALADVFQDRLDGCRNSLIKDKGQDIPEDRCFVGFDAFQKLIDTDVDVILTAAPPGFRPGHFAAAIAAGKHVFMEKPIAVDPVGIRTIREAAAMADQKGLNVVVGTQRRHQASYLACKERIDGGEIGEIVGGRCYWNGQQPWGGWDRTDILNTVGDQVRAWLFYQWLSGDHIVEQHVHNIDVALWFMGKTPVAATGMGYRVRKTFGDGYDFYCVDFDMGNGVSLESQCRQIENCDNNVSEWVMGTRGWANCGGEIFDLDGKRVWNYDGPGNNPYVQEHTDLANAIRSGEQKINNAHGVADSTLAAIMGRTSAYTGKTIRWDDISNATWKLGPSEPWTELTVDTPYDAPPVPVPGMTTY